MKASEHLRTIIFMQKCISEDKPMVREYSILCPECKEIISLGLSKERDISDWFFNEREFKCNCGFTAPKVALTFN